MEISPIEILYMIICALCFGAVCGLLNDVNRFVRVFMGVKYGGKSAEALYEKKLPIIGRALGRVKESAALRVLQNVTVFFQDLALLVFAGCGVAVINYYFNYGRVRIYAPAAALLGFLFYYFTLGRVFVRIFEVAAFFVKAFLCMILSILYVPIGFFVNFLVKNIKKFAKKVCKAIAKKQKKVYNNKKEIRVMSAAAYGFVNMHKS